MKNFFIILFIISVAYSVPPWMLGDSKAENIQIKLVTIGPGDELTMWWGHNAVIVEDTSQQVSRFYNYGLFSFDQDNFLFNFARGRLIFWVGDSDTYKALSYYRSLNRDIRIQILNLSPGKKLEMAKFLAINVLPENRYYLYDHYIDNCATRVRDLVNKSTDNQLKKHTQDVCALTFRGHTRRFTYHHFFMDWLLEFLMGDRIDKPISKWEAMFLPVELEKNIAELYFTYDGEKKPLVENSYVYFSAQGRDPVPDLPPDHIFKGIITGSILAIITIILASFMHKQNKFSKKLLGFYTGFIGFIFGIPGLVLFMLSLFTDHSVTYFNENLYLANPLTILFIPLGIMFGYEQKFSFKWLPVCCYIHVLSGTLLLILKLLPAFDQENWLAIITILPVYFALSLCFLFLPDGQLHRQ